MQYYRTCILHVWDTKLQTTSLYIVFICFYIHVKVTKVSKSRGNYWRNISTKPWKICWNFWISFFTASVNSGDDFLPSSPLFGKPLTEQHVYLPFYEGSKMQSRKFKNHHKCCSSEIYLFFVVIWCCNLVIFIKNNSYFWFNLIIFHCMQK